MQAMFDVCQFANVVHVVHYLFVNSITSTERIYPDKHPEKASIVQNLDFIHCQILLSCLVESSPGSRTRMLLNFALSNLQIPKKYSSIN